jgi:hypothetical protein
MTGGKLMAIVVFTALGVCVVAWLGYEYRNEVVGFLRALTRALLRGH